MDFAPVLSCSNGIEIELEDRLRESIDDVDDAEARSTPEAMAAEQAVKAAQQVYEGVVKEARAKIRTHRMNRMR